MADHAIEQIKQRINIVDEIGLIVNLRRSGKAYKGLCPFHSERTPSFYVFPETGTWRCFGCNEGGDIFVFLEKHRGLTFYEALTELAEKTGIEIGVGADFAHEPSLATLQRKRILELNEEAAVWFHHQLLTTHAATYARSYVQSRGISNESLGRFRLGFAPDGSQLAAYLLSRGYSESELIDTGLVRKREDGNQSIYDYFRNRLIFPIRDTHERTIAFGGRDLGGGTPKYLNSPQTSVFDKSATLYAIDQAREAIRRLDEVIIVEGYVDAVMAHQYGYRNVVACIGSAITSKHVQSIKKLTRRLVLALDPDSAGEMATLRAIEVAQEGFDRISVPILSTPSAANSNSRRPQELPQPRFEEQVDAEIRIMQLPDGIDPDEYIRGNPQAWETATKAALPLMEYYFESILQSIDIHTATGKLEASKRLIAIVASLGEPIKRDLYSRRIAAILHLDEKSISSEIQRAQRQRTRSTAQKGNGGQEDSVIGDKYHSSLSQQGQKSPVPGALEARLSAGRALEEHIISILLSWLWVAPEVYGILTPSDFEGTETRALYSALNTLHSQLTHFTQEDMVPYLPTYLHAEAERIRDLPIVQRSLDRAQIVRNAKQAAVRLKRQRLSDAITELSSLQREAAEQHDNDAVRILREQSQHLLKQRLTIDTAGMLQS